MVTTEYAPITQNGNGVITAFNFSFKILAATDLVVAKTDASGNQSGTLILGVDYTVVFDSIAETGTVTFTVPPVNNGSCTIARVSNNQQESSLPPEGAMPAKTVETMVDKLTLLLQEAQLNLANAGTMMPFQMGAFATLDAAAGSLMFIAVVTDRGPSVWCFTGNRAYGQNGWYPLGG